MVNKKKFIDTMSNLPAPGLDLLSLRFRIFGPISPLVVERAGIRASVRYVIYMTIRGEEM